MNYETLFNLFDRKHHNIDETSFYFKTDPDEVEHFIGYLPKYELPYWVGYCDVENGWECKTAKELFEAPIFDGKSIKDRWDEIVFLQIGGINIEDWKNELLLLKSYLYVDQDAYYTYNGKEYAQSVHGRSYLRYKKAIIQSEKDPVPVERIIEIIKRFLTEIGIKTSENPVMDNPLNINYQEIKIQFELDDQKDIVWLKFTKDGYLGVVATSDDINFDFPNSKDDYDKKHRVYNAYTRRYEDEWMFNTSGILVHKLNKMWDESFVILFPLNGIPDGYRRGDIEHAIGNLLIENDVPILDYFSHLY